MLGLAVKRNMFEEAMVHTEKKFNTLIGCCKSKKRTFLNLHPSFFYIMRNETLDFLQQNHIILSLKRLTYKQVS